MQQHLNDGFGKGTWTTGKNILSGLGGLFDISSPDRITMLKYPESSRIIVQESVFKTR